MGVAVGNAYGALMLFGHELAHGAMVRSRRAQNALLYLTGLIFCLPPGFWRVWHHTAHHAHTNVPDRDPDNFGTFEGFRPTPMRRLLMKFAPGSGHWLSGAYLFTFFTVHSQWVLWAKSRDWGWSVADRRRAMAESLGMAAWWVGFGYTLGWWAAVVAVLIPMAVANAVIMSYIVTNHLLRPLSARRNTLATTMSVRTWRVLDLLHFHFSHHVEHHLFPGMSGRLPARPACPPPASPRAVLGPPSPTGSVGLVPDPATVHPHDFPDRPRRAAAGRHRGHRTGPPRRPASGAYGRRLRMLKAAFDYLCSRVPGVPFAVEFWDGTRRVYGPGEPRFTLRLLDRGACARVLLNPGVRFLDAYVAGAIDIAGDVREAFRALAGRRPRGGSGRPAGSGLGPAG